MRIHRPDQLIKSLLLEVVGGGHPENHRFLPRRRIERLWGVSNRTVQPAIAWLVEQGVLRRTNRKVILLAPGGIRKARGCLRRFPTPPLPQPNRDTDRSPDPVSESTPGQPLLSERLGKSLLMEVASGAYKPGHRFLSRRAIELTWKISKPTAERARSMLIAWKILRPLNARLVGVAPGAVGRACLRLTQMPFDPLPPPETWKIRRNRLLHGETKPGGYRLAIVHLVSSLNISQLQALARSRSSADLNDKLVGQRHFISFLAEARRHACETLFFKDHEDPARAGELVRKLMDQHVEGAALIDWRRSPAWEALVSEMQKQGLSVVTAFENFEGRPDSSVECNETAAGYEAMKILLEAGHANILLINGPKSKPFLHRRQQGAWACLRDARPTSQLCIRQRILSGKPGDHIHRVLRPLFRSKTGRPTAVLLLDTLLLPAIEPVLHDAGVRIPEDLSIIGCGARGHRWEGYPLPDIMDRDHAELGATAARQLIKMIHGDPVARTVQLQTTYLRRGTVVPPTYRTRRRE